MFHPSVASSQSTSKRHSHLPGALLAAEVNFQAIFCPISPMALNASHHHRDGQARSHPVTALEVTPAGHRAICPAEGWPGGCVGLQRVRMTQLKLVLCTGASGSFSVSSPVIPKHGAITADALVHADHYLTGYDAASCTGAIRSVKLNFNIAFGHGRFRVLVANSTDSSMLQIVGESTFLSTAQQCPPDAAPD